MWNSIRNRKSVFNYIYSHNLFGDRDRTIEPVHQVKGRSEHPLENIHVSNNPPEILDISSDKSFMSCSFTHDNMYHQKNPKQPE